MTRVFLPLLFAGCVAYDPELGRLADQGDTDASQSVPCEDPSEAIIRVEEYAFSNVCGCAEGAVSDAKSCTVIAGTNVVWQFMGSLDHNVHSEGGFTSSNDRLRGEHVVTFAAPGEYPYECSIHAGIMSDYKVVVLSP